MVLGTSNFPIMKFIPISTLLLPLLFFCRTFGEEAKAIDTPLWNGDPPGMVEGATPGADDGTGRWRNVGVPGMLIYLPDKPAPEGGRVALIACPGGGYTHLTRLVGADGAVKAFLPGNVAIISLKYRTAPPSRDIQKDALEDGKRAVQLVRHHGREWGIHPQKIGVVGWSAGANLVLNVASRFDNGTVDAKNPVSRVSSRPDFVILLSPWPAKKASTDYPIPNNAPPAFIGTAEDDKTAPSSFAKAIGEAYQERGSRATCGSSKPAATEPSRSESLAPAANGSSACGHGSANLASSGESQDLAARISRDCVCPDGSGGCRVGFRRRTLPIFQSRKWSLDS